MRGVMYNQGCGQEFFYIICVVIAIFKWNLESVNLGMWDSCGFCTGQIYFANPWGHTETSRHTDLSRHTSSCFRLQTVSIMHHSDTTLQGIHWTRTIPGPRAGRLDRDMGGRGGTLPPLSLLISLVARHAESGMLS